VQQGSRSVQDEKQSSDLIVIVKYLFLKLNGSFIITYKLPNRFITTLFSVSYRPVYGLPCQLLSITHY
jgi:hypothetical protein